MTEAVWLWNSDPHWLLQTLRRMPAFQGAGGARKFRLLAVANCRTVEEFYRHDPGSVARVQLAERVADGLDSADELPRYEALPPILDDDAAGLARHLTRIATVADVPTAVEQSCSFARAARERGARRNSDECSPDEVQVRLIRDIFGNPYLPVACDPAWRTSDVLLLARGIYEDRAFDRLPILADALQDAGCNDRYILNHCRSTNTLHARGCWVVDLVLGL
jgi:hypothetical protein